MPLTFSLWQQFEPVRLTDNALRAMYRQALIAGNIEKAQDFDFILRARQASDVRKIYGGK